MTRTIRLLAAVLLVSACTARDAEPDPSSDTASGGGAAPGGAATPTPGGSAVPDTSSPAADAPRPDEPTLTFATGTGTAGVTTESRSDMPPAILRTVRTASHSNFDRVVFEFDGTRVPGYHIEYIDSPVRQCGSGNPVDVAGDGWLEVRLEPARAHEGETEVRVTVENRNRRPNLTNLQQLVLTCDFEAQVAWVLGLASPDPYRVMELQNPARLVVDVRHGG